MTRADDDGGGEARWLLLIFALALAARATFLLELQGSTLLSVLVGDARQFDAWGGRMAAGDWVGDDLYFMAPLYPYFLGAVYAVFGHAPQAVRWIQAGLGAGTCVLVAVAAGRLFRAHAGDRTGRYVGRVAGVFLALYAPAIWHDVLVQKTALASFFTALFLASFASWSARPRPRGLSAPLVVAGLALGLLGVTRENAAILLVAALLWIGFAGRARPAPDGERAAAPGARLARAAVLLLAFLVPILPFALRNRLFTGELRTTYNLGVNFYIGNSRDADGLYRPLLPGRGRPDYEREDATRLAAETLGHEPTPSEVSRFWLARAARDIRARPGGWLRLLGRKTLLLLQAREAMDSVAMEAHEARSRLLRALNHVLHFGILLPLAAVGLWTTRARRRELWFVYAALLLVALSVVLFFVFARIRYTLVPLLVPFAAAGLVELGARLRRRSGLVMPLLLVAGSAVLVTRAGPPPGDPRARTLSNLGVTLLEEDRVEEATAHLREAVEREPELADAWFDLGAALARGGDPEGAAEAYLRSAALQPSYTPDVFERVGQIRSDQGDLASAEGWFESARELAPERPEAWHDLGYLRALQGRTTEAVALYREALARDPGFLPSLRELAYVLAAHPDESVRDADAAVRLVEHALSIAGDDPGLLDLLAVARAAQGRFDEAAEIAERAARLADEAGEPELAAAIRGRLELYRRARTIRGS